MLVDGTNWLHWPEPQNQDFGPWLHDGYLYIFMSEELAVTGQSFCRILVQPEDEPYTPWVEVDAANHPEMSFDSAGVYYDEAANTVCVIRVHEGDSILNTFVMGSGGTGTWQADISSFSDYVPVDAIRLHKSGSDYIVYFDFDPAAGFYSQPHWRKYDGTWSAPVLVSTNFGASNIVYPSQMGVDDSGLLHLFWRAQPASSTNHLNARTLDPATGTLGTVRTLTGSTQTHIFAGNTVEWDGDVLCPFVNRIAGPVSQVRVAYGNPTSNPTWTEELVHTDTDVSTDVWLVKRGANIELWWATNSDISYRTKAPGGSWSAATVYYSWDTTKKYVDDDGATQVNWPVSNFFHSGSVTQHGITIGGFIEPYSTGFSLQGPWETPPEPPGGTVRLMYSFLGRFPLSAQSGTSGDGTFSLLT